MGRVQLDPRIIGIVFGSSPPFQAILGPPGDLFWGGGPKFFLGGPKGGGPNFFGGGPKCLSRECTTLHKLLLNRYDKQTYTVNISFLRTENVVFEAPT